MCTLKCVLTNIYAHITNSPIKMTGILFCGVTTVSSGTQTLRIMSPINSVWKIIIEYEDHLGNLKVTLIQLKGIIYNHSILLLLV